MKLRLAIVGAGPAGIYAADILLKHERSFDVSIDLFDQLPAPYGLVRYGVAPDHPRIKGIINALRDVLDRGDIRIFGNVRFGEDLTLDDLQNHYHAVIFSTGAVRDAELRIPGIELPGSYGAADFVSWYDGHPDYPREWPLEAESIAVVGNGNVALDVARMLVKHPEDLLPTEIPTNVYEGLQTSPVTDVHVFGRRGPMQVKFTPLELRELGELRDVDMIVHEEDFDYDEASKAAIESNKQVLVIDRVFTQWRAREVGQASRRLHFHFYAKPLEVVAGEGGCVGAFRYERTEPDGHGGVRGTVIGLHGCLDGLRTEQDGSIYAESGVHCARLAKFSVQQGRGGGAFLAGIPGTVGGALAMNAGAHGGETWPRVREVEVLYRDGSAEWLTAERFSYGYRHVRLPENFAGFLAVRFDFPQDDAEQAAVEMKDWLARRKATQPVGKPSCGSVFRNPPNDHAARLIEFCGLKGYRIGGAVVSPMHANFIINEDQASAADIERLITHVRETVMTRTGVALEPEVRIVGEHGGGR